MLGSGPERACFCWQGRLVRARTLGVPGPPGLGPRPLSSHFLPRLPGSFTLSHRLVETPGRGSEPPAPMQMAGGAQLRV